MLTRVRPGGVLRYGARARLSHGCPHSVAGVAHALWRVFCPQCLSGFYGNTCEACAPCSGAHKQCDGSGTRSGTGACVCETGWSGDDCDTCADHFQPPNCDACVTGFYPPGVCDTCETGYYGCVLWRRPVLVPATRRLTPMWRRRLARRPNCDACPTCGAHSYCDGSGTTTGSGECTCDAGWAPPGCTTCVTGRTGSDCTECSEGYYGSDCTPCPGLSTSGGSTTVCNGHGTCDGSGTTSTLLRVATVCPLSAVLRMPVV